MSLIYPLLSILGECAGKLCDKACLKWHNIDYRPTVTVVLGIMFILTTVFLAVTKQVFPNITTTAWIIIAAMIIFSTLSNITDSRGLSLENLSTREPFANFTPLLAGLFAFFLFPSEQNVLILLFVAIGASALVFANTKGGKIFATKGKKDFLKGVIFESLTLNTYKAAVLLVPAAWIFFFRMLGVFLLSTIFLKFDISTMSKIQWKYMIGAGVAYFIGSLAQLYAIATLGLLKTMMLLMLLPVIKYASSYFILKEEVTKKQMLASVILIVLAALTTIV